MTPGRLREIMDRCIARRRNKGLVVHQQQLARFLGVTPMTLRRWLKGERPIPRTVEAIMEMYDAYPEEVAALTAASYGPKQQNVPPEVT